MRRTLILIPTRSERLVLEPLLEPILSSHDRVELCGFGLVAAAARSSQLIADVRPDHVILTGVAGSFSDNLPVGSATTFDEVACYGIGAGSGVDHQTAGDIGWNHIGGQRSEAGISDLTISDTMAIGSTSRLDDMVRSCQLLSVAAASGNSHDAVTRLRRFPDAAAEDMEGFAVATACRLADVSLTIVRGISNHVGDRNIDNWQIEPALKAAAKLVLQLASNR